MSIINTITYTTLGIGCQIEHTTTLTRGYKLTNTGAERILKREMGDASICVTMIQTMIDAR